MSRSDDGRGRKKSQFFKNKDIDAAIEKTETIYNLTRKQIKEDITDYLKENFPNDKDFVEDRMEQIYLPMEKIINTGEEIQNLMTFHKNKINDHKILEFFTQSIVSAVKFIEEDIGELQPYYQIGHRIKDQLYNGSQFVSIIQGAYEKLSQK